MLKAPEQDVVEKTSHPPAHQPPQRAAPKWCSGSKRTTNLRHQWFVAAKKPSLFCKVICGILRTWHVWLLVHNAQQLWCVLDI
eukprot:2597710-Amphidinium_carterae.1